MFGQAKVSSQWQYVAHQWAVAQWHSHWMVDYLFASGIIACRIFDKSKTCRTRGSNRVLELLCSVMVELPRQAVYTQYERIYTWQVLLKEAKRSMK
jgi:hypothetical protein